MLSLIHLLAARACHADTLKRALLHNPEACRLLAYFGVTPTHLEDIAKGNTSRLRAATSTTLADYLLLYAQLHTVNLESPEADAIRDRMDAPWNALTSKEHEAVRVVGALYDRLAKLQAERGDIRTQADFEYRLAEADEHVRVTDKRLLHAAEFENEVLTLLGVEYRSEALDAIRALHGRLAAAEEDGARSIDCMNEVEDLLGIKAEGREDVLDAIRSLRRRAKFAEASAQELRQRLQAEIMAHSTTRMFAESAEAASEHGPLADLTVWTGLPVRVVHQPTAPEEFRFSAHVDGHDGAAGRTPRQALLALREKVKATLPTKPPEPIVLGPWRKWAHLPVWCRQIVGTKNDGIQVSIDGWLVADRAGSRVCHGEADGEAGKAAADAWARLNGYVLLDAEPGSLSGVLPTLHRQTLGCGIYWWRCAAQTDVEVTIYERAHTGVPGWRILQWLDVGEARSVAHGPQTGEEGKRYALAAARALGKTWNEK